MVHTFNDLRSDLDVVAAVQWTNTQASQPISDLCNIAHIALLRYGDRYTRALMHPKTAAMLAASAEFEHAARIYVDPGKLRDDNAVRDYCRKNFVQLFEYFLQMKPELNESMGIGIVTLMPEDYERVPSREIGTECRYTRLARLRAFDVGSDRLR
jgi:hypothetical protein